MPAYQFTALDASGKQQKGVLEGDSARQIRQQLRDKALIPISVDPVEQKQKHQAQRWFQKKMTAYDLALMTRQLSVLVAAAIPLEEALRAVAKQSEKAHVQNLLLSVRSKVLEGYSLANALQQSGHFPDLYIATIAAGERSGHLDLILDQLSDYTENRFAMQKKVQGAMIYPIILMLMSFAIVMGLMTYVVPDIVKTFDQDKGALPWITVALMQASDFIRLAWPFLLVGTILGIFLLVRFLKTSAGHYAFDRLTLKLPLFGKLSRGINAARFASTLSILTQSGVPLVDALKIGAAVSSNWVIRDSVNLAAEKVTEGGNLGTQLERSGYFPPMMVQMIKSGEASGELDRMLERASTMQDREVTTLISTLLALLEPLMLVLMASIVLVIVIAVMLPIVNMNNMI
ncbi:type II secretion system inner membrane protein GspF [Acinetobacter indicus]|jgi:general secretion pathway protein F|uniref:General secretion pathway protein F n=1 Tax=Acinetobacter indicus TaxID=756892 RepID=A0AAW8Z3J3_9GAMM|nr:MULTISPECIES: type II secretion system inner membrane protein GspF [Acinetobacter]AVH15187.1 type II secretion system protein GspF [Acinetobacter indicus]KJV45096.1 general secretion pathway protein GspF [Acinetobacter indicus]MCO8089420.1 type II secretion system inner membrane protein GspF [Acinetobacter indicus]MCO8102304.1 type II secretion system inner membrane protein GspF [Acinetobacter indicus]MDM1263820.1 type II secretion system inner membrane protein GspF [Acinetobacter indicus]